MKTALGFLLLITLGSISLRGGEAVVTRGAGAEIFKPWALDISPEWLHNDDLSESTAALSWDIGWSTAADGLPLSYFEASFHSEGTVALNEDLNNTPLVVELDAFGQLQLGSKKSNQMAKPRIEAVTVDEIPDLTGTKFHPFLLQTGLSARYETDQRLDHRNGVGSVFVELSNNNRESGWALIPTFRVAVDGVVPDKNVTADSLSASMESHLRFRALAHWNIGLGLLYKTPVLVNSFVSATLQYSRDFGIDQKLKDAGQEESFGAAIEYAYLLNRGSNEGEVANDAPWFAFARLEAGSFAPQPEDSTTFLVGFRFGMGDAVKLLSR